MLWILGPAAATSGVVAGAVMRNVLGRLARGTLVRPPLCEVLVAVLWTAMTLGWVMAAVPARWVPALLGLAWLGVAVTVVDLRHHRIPDALTLPALPVAVVCVVPLGGAAVFRALAGAALAVAVHAAVHLASPRSMGAGDIKLAAPLGAVLGAAGWLALPVAAVLAALLTAVLGAVGILRHATPGRRAPGRRANGRRAPGRRAPGPLARSAPVPHGPSMVLAAVLVTGFFAMAGAAPPSEARPPTAGSVAAGCTGSVGAVAGGGERR